MLEMLLWKVGFALVEKAIDSTSNKTDDKVLAIVQKGAKYLSKQPNNNLSQNQAKSLENTSMMKTQG